MRLKAENVFLNLERIRNIHMSPGIMKIQVYHMNYVLKQALRTAVCLHITNWTIKKWKTILCEKVIGFDKPIVEILI